MGSTLKRKVVTVELATGEIVTARVIHPDVIRYQETAQRHQWPTLTIKDGAGSTPHLNYEDTFTAWAALRRTNQYAGKWETFKDTDCVELVVDVEDVTPTVPSSVGPTLPAGDASPSNSPASPVSTSDG
jgi:hypothetical protein